ncbi:transcription elongation factor GreA [Salmonella enterica]|nr:transcription elongation factor GreA [Salmonella enterica]
MTDILGSDDDNPVKASKAELDSVLGVQDLWDLLEIIQVDAHNERVMQETQNGSGT